jgi:hypothetical protein
MIFSFTATPDFDFLTYFARHLQTAVNNDMMLIPENLGQGYIRKLAFGPHFKITIHSYLLKEDLIIKRNSSGVGNDLITIFFYSNQQALEIAYNNNAQIQFSLCGYCHKAILLKGAIIPNPSQFCTANHHQQRQFLPFF